jgi:hypothetical protein
MGMISEPGMGEKNISDKYDPPLNLGWVIFDLLGKIFTISGNLRF